MDALGVAKERDRNDVAHLIFGIQAAGGWQKYVAARRMEYIRIRHTVGQTYAVVPKGSAKLKDLYHFVFGRNEVLPTSDGEHEAKVLKSGWRLTLPLELFARVIGYLES